MYMLMERSSREGTIDNAREGGWRVVEVVFLSGVSLGNEGLIFARSVTTGEKPVYNDTNTVKRIEVVVVCKKFSSDCLVKRKIVS